MAMGTALQSLSQTRKPNQQHLQEWGSVAAQNLRCPLEGKPPTIEAATWRFSPSAKEGQAF